jgi:predicted outer membrane repeat protein
MKHVIMQKRRWGWLRGLTGGPDRRSRHRLKPVVLALEDRRLLATIPVTNTNPSGSGSLAAAIAIANGNNQANTINFQGSIWNTLQTITLSGSVLDLTDTVGTQTIMGPTVGVTISGASLNTVFEVNSGVTADFSSLTITHGVSPTGGGLLNDGTVTLSDCTFAANSAANGKVNNGGGLFNEGMAMLSGCIISGNSAAAGGGGLFNEGAATLSNCSFNKNSSAGGGGGLLNEGTAMLSNCAFNGNSAVGGGGLTNDSKAVLIGCTLSGNSATSVGGGGMDNVNDNGMTITSTLTSCIISGNSAHGGGGGVEDFGTAFGAVTLTNCIIKGNSAAVGGGVFDDSSPTFGTAPISGCTISGNSATSGGGGVYIDNPTVTLSGCTISGNSAGGNGGGVDRYASGAISNCTISGNSAGDNGGGIYNSNGNDALTLSNCIIDGNSADFGGGVQNTGSAEPLLGPAVATLSGCTINGNVAFSGGGGVNNGGTGTDTLTDCVISLNVASFGGGVNDGANVTETLSGCTLSGNSAQTGGGVDIFGSSMFSSCTLSGNAANFGGAVQNTGTAVLTNCTISGDIANQGGGGVNNGGSGKAMLTGCALSGNIAYFGGGVNIGADATTTLTGCTLSGNSAQNGGGLENFGKLMLTNCTFAGNSAVGSGGGIEAQGNLTVTSSTFSGNHANYGGAIDNYYGDYKVTVENSILAGDSAATGPEVCNSVTSGGHNLVAEVDGSSGWVSTDFFGTVARPLNALLSALGNYGGPTQTLALLPGSPVIGKGIAVSGVSTDQRGVTRPSSGVDIGAFQSQGFTLTPVSGSTPQSATINTAFAKALAVTVTAKDSLEPVAGGVITFAAPSSGATAGLSGTTATIGSNGAASVNATANNTTGTYHVTATAAGAAASASFTLTNTALVIVVYDAASASITTGTSQPGTLTVQSAAQTLPADPNGKTSGPAPAGTSTAFTALGLVNGQPVPRVIPSGAGWRSPRPWMAQAMRPRPAQQSTKVSITTRSLVATSP